mmetsp:Transcript_14728/g.21839  ORF Transcript_14728/g.21839 Transcript_14728/m.21839 type:complete len:435 (+) Transcript_14728:48-1352(+)
MLLRFGKTTLFFGRRRSIAAYYCSSAVILSLGRYTTAAATTTSSLLSSLATSHQHRKMTNLTFQQIIPAPHTNTTNANTASSSSTPLPRSSHGLSIIHNGTLLVLYGGEHIARTPIHNPSQVLWLAKRMTGTESWQWIVPTTTNAAITPPSRVAHAQAAVGNTIYIFGGRNGIEMGENAMNDMWMLTLHEDETTAATAKWTQINASSNDTPSDVLPEARSFHKMIAIGSNLYMFGGCGARSGRLNDLWKFDTLTHKWTNLGVSHVLRGRGGPNILSLAHDKKIGIVGGFAGEETNDGHVYGISSSDDGVGSSWEEEGMKGLEEMRPRSVCCFASLPMVNKCVIFGGEVDPSQKGHEGAGGFERDVVILDGTSGSVLENIKPSSGNEVEEEEWPRNRGWADATVHEDTMYIFGGLAGDDASPIRLNDLWQCKVSP